MTGKSYSRGGIQDLIAEKAKDASFRKALMADPKASLENALGAEIPAGVKVKFMEESGDRVSLVPPAATKEGAELDDAQLEKVAGGMADKAHCSAKLSSIINISAG